MPRGHPFTLKISERIEDFVQLVLLPLFFTLSGGWIGGVRGC